MNSLYTIYRFSNKKRKWSYVSDHKNIDEIHIALTLLLSSVKKNKLNCFVVLREQNKHINFVYYSEEFFKFVDVEKLEFKSGLAIAYQFKNKEVKKLSDKEEELIEEIASDINLWIFNDGILIEDIYKKTERLNSKKNNIQIFRHALLRSQYYYFVRDIIKYGIENNKINLTSKNKNPNLLWQRQVENVWGRINANTFFGEDEFQKIKKEI